ncbi:type IV secretion protein rhs [Haloferula helveola]|uniref:Type IV secretion protein rhs n=1 Tax=Haloferula helveola TaxID=490095 RepID=A0ABN6H7L9_9BACT|nr:type IV secretion protein rhs [Haloferula helveola]
MKPVGHLLRTLPFIALIVAAPALRAQFGPNNVVPDDPCDYFTFELHRDDPDVGGRMETTNESSECNKLRKDDTGLIEFKAVGMTGQSSHHIVTNDILSYYNSNDYGWRVVVGGAEVGGGVFPEGDGDPMTPDGIDTTIEVDLNRIHKSGKFEIEIVYLGSQTSSKSVCKRYEFCCRCDSCDGESCESTETSINESDGSLEISTGAGSDSTGVDGGAAVTAEVSDVDAFRSDASDTDDLEVSTSGQGYSVDKNPGGGLFFTVTGDWYTTAGPVSATAVTSKTYTAPGGTLLYEVAYEQKSGTWGNGTYDMVEITRTNSHTAAVTTEVDQYFEVSPTKRVLVEEGLRTTIWEKLSVTPSSYLTRIKVIEAGQTVSDKLITWKSEAYGYRKTKEVIDPDGAALTTTWSYYPSTAAFNARGRVMRMVEPTGQTTDYSYTTTGTEVKRKYGSTLEEKVTTSIVGDETTVTRAVDSTIVSKTVIDSTTARRIVKSYSDAANFLTTTTWFRRDASDFDGTVASVDNPDGTRTVYTRSIDGNGHLNVRVERGAFTGTTLDDGDSTLTITDLGGHLISRTTTDAVSNAITDDVIVTDSDTMGRPIEYTWFGGAYVTSRSFACCGVVDETDRYGVVTYHAYDALKRRTKSNRLGVTTHTVYDGLTVSTHRYAEIVDTGVLVNGAPTAGTEISRSVRNLAGTYSESRQVSPKTGTLIKLNDSTTTYLNPVADSPTQGLEGDVGMRVVTTRRELDSGGSDIWPAQTTDHFKDGRIKKSTGALVPARTYEYGVDSATTAGIYEYSTQAYLDGGTAKERSIVLVDWLGRSVYSGPCPNSGIPDHLSSHSYDSTTGQLLSSVDADGVTTSYAYNDRGERTTTAIDLNNDGIDLGTDIVSRVESTVVSAHSTVVRRTATTVWLDDSTPLVLSHEDVAVNGLGSWSIFYPGANAEESSSITDLGTAGDGDWTVTSTDSADAFAEKTFTDGLLETVKFFKSAGGTPTEQTTFTTYDTLNRPTHVTDARTGTTVTTYSSLTLDTVASVAVPGRGTVAYTYDHQGRMVKENLPDTDDEAGNNLVNEITSRFHTDGTLASRSGGQTYDTSHTYDYARRKKTLTTNYGATNSPSTTEWFYDTTLGRLARKEYDDGKGIDYTYTDAGRLKSREWSRDINGADPSTTMAERLKATYTYDSAGRLHTVTYNDAVTDDLQYEYDHLNRMNWVKQGGVKTHEYFYNSGDLLLDYEKVSYDLNGDNDTVDAGDLVRVIDRSYESGSGTSIHRRPSGFSLQDTANTPNVDHAVGYHYESGINRLLGISANGVPNLTGKSYAFEYEYGVTNSASLLSKVTGPAHTVENSWFASRDILALKENKGGGSTLRSSYDYDFVVGMEAHTVNEIGQRGGVLTDGTAFSSAPTYLWGYNANGEVTSSDSDTGTGETADDRHFTYDGIGNRLESRSGTSSSSGGAAIAYTPTALNQYSSIASSSPVHDLDGNLTTGGLRSGALQSLSGTAFTATLSWDAENRLIAVADSSAVVATYEYDYMGRRITATAAGTKTVFVYDGWNLIAEFEFIDESSAPKLDKTYTWGLDLNGSLRWAGGVGALLSMRDESSTPFPVYYPTYDGNGNVSEYLESSGAVVVHFEYDPFGTLLVSTDATGFFRFRYSTKPLDHQTGLYYYGYRYYDPVMGRWPSRDPIEERGGINLYGFVYNEPIGWIDVLGGSPRKPGGSGWHGGPSGRSKSKGQPGVNPLDALRRMLGIPFDILSGDLFLARVVGSNFDDTQCEFLITVTGIRTKGVAQGDGSENGNAEHRDRTSELPGYENVPNSTYVDNPTAVGGLGDFVQIVGDTVGAISITSERLANVIRKAYAKGLENGCEEKCIKIHLVAHSQGAAISTGAFALLPANIKDNIYFIGLGGQHRVGADGLGGSRNIENIEDIVPKIPNQISDIPGVGPEAEKFRPEDVGLPDGEESGPVSGHTLGNEKSGGDGAYYKYLEQHPW